MNKKILFLVFVLCVSAMFIGCKRKAPEGITQEFYDDMIISLKKLEKEKGNKETNGYDEVKRYLDNKIWLTHKEQETIEAIDDMYFWVWFYYNTDDAEALVVKSKIRDVVGLMELNINVDKIIIKK